MVAANELVFTVLLTILLATLFVHFSARVLLGESTPVQALIGVSVGALLAGLISVGADAAGWSDGWGLFLALAGFALALALVYRTAWLKGALVGVVAWVLYAFARYVVQLIIG